MIMDAQTIQKTLSSYQQRVVREALKNGGFIAEDVTINTRKVLKRHGLISYEGASAVLTPEGRQTGELILQND